jgi:hypothetical protein
MFDIDCGQVGGFLLSTTVSSTNNANSHDIIEKLLKVACSSSLCGFDHRDA